MEVGELYFRRKIFPITSSLDPQKPIPLLRNCFLERAENLFILQKPSSL